MLRCKTEDVAFVKTAFVTVLLVEYNSPVEILVLAKIVPVVNPVDRFKVEELMLVVIRSPAEMDVNRECVIEL